MTIEVVNETDVDIDIDAMSDQARFVLDRLRIHPLSDLSVVLVDVAAMTDLHVRWMDEPGPTDVLSFPMDEMRQPDDGEEPEPGTLGDVVICPEVAQQQAQVAGHSREQEMSLLLTHGILHLLGYDHAEPDEEKEMFALQRQLLEEWVAEQVAAYLGLVPAEWQSGSSVKGRPRMTKAGPAHLRRLLYMRIARAAMAGGANKNSVRVKAPATNAPHGPNARCANANGPPVCGIAVESSVKLKMKHT